jgi:hypothetical protein
MRRLEVHRQGIGFVSLPVDGVTAVFRQVVGDVVKGARTSINVDGVIDFFF